MWFLVSPSWIARRHCCHQSPFYAYLRKGREGGREGGGREGGGREGRGRWEGGRGRHKDHVSYHFDNREQTYWWVWLTRRRNWVRRHSSFSCAAASPPAEEAKNGRRRMHESQRVYLTQCIHASMRISTNHNSLGCEQPSRPRCSQCAGRISANARPPQLHWGDRECGCFTPYTYNTDGWPY